MIKDEFVKKLSISFGVIVLGIAIGWGVTSFLAGDIASRVKAIIASRSTIAEQTNSVANLANFERAAPLAAQYQAEMDQVLPTQYGLVSFGQWFSSEGQKYGVTASASLQGTTVPPAAAAPGTVTFSFSAEGSFATISSFLKGASTDSSGFLFSFDSFDVSTDGANDKITGQGTLFFK